jgi:serine/threonine protein phosphatase PrpC
MVVYEWFARFGQVIAPDENYKPETTEKDPSIWDILAPDPNFSSVVAASPLTSAVDALMRSPPPQQREHPDYTTPPVGATFAPCSSCITKLCPACKEKAGAAGSERKLPTVFTPSPFRGSGSSSSMQTPRSTTSYSDAKVEGRVLTAAKKQAETMASPVGARLSSNNIIRLCASAAPLGTPLQIKLRTELEKKSNRTVLIARSSNMGSGCPDGYTPFMAAAYANQVRAAEIIADFVNNNEAVISTEQLLLETNLQGKTAFHIAAEKGHSEFLRFIKSKHVEAFGEEASVPMDLIGRTPLGAALMSPDPKVKRNKSVLMEQLYRDTDKSVRGSPLPVEHRVVYASDDNLHVVAGLSEMPGKRIRMEDCTIGKTTKSAVLLAVCDGHDDEGLVSRFVAEGWVTALDDRLPRMQLPAAEEEWQASCKDICLITDDALRKAKLRGGSVAVFIAVADAQIVVANVGDCRCILVQFKADLGAGLVASTKKMSLNDGQEKARSDVDAAYSVIALSNDHKPNLPIERARIERAGLSVKEETFLENDEEVTIFKVDLSDGNRLACSRAFGDFEYKDCATLESEEQAVTAVPEVVVHSRCAEDAFLVAACDGVWDVMTNEDVAKFITERVEHHCSASDAVTTAILPTVGDELLFECLNRGSGDNMSVVIVALSTMADRLLGSAAALSLQGKALNFAAVNTTTPGQGSNEASEQ